MKDESVSIGTDYGSQQRGYERHIAPKQINRSPGFSVERALYFIVNTTPCWTGRKSNSWSITNPIGSISRRISSKLILWRGEAGAILLSFAYSITATRPPGFSARRMDAIIASGSPNSWYAYAMNTRSTDRSGSLALCSVARTYSTFVSLC